MAPSAAGSALGSEVNSKGKPSPEVNSKGKALDNPGCGVEGFGLDSQLL